MAELMTIFFIDGQNHLFTSIGCPKAVTGMIAEICRSFETCETLEGSIEAVLTSTSAKTGTQPLLKIAQIVAGKVNEGTRIRADLGSDSADSASSSAEVQEDALRQ